MNAAPPAPVGTVSVILFCPNVKPVISTATGAWPGPFPAVGTGHTLQMQAKLVCKIDYRGHFPNLLPIDCMFFKIFAVF
jgi:hypothetical protein